MERQNAAGAPAAYDDVAFHQKRPLMGPVLAYDSSVGANVVVHIVDTDGAYPRTAAPVKDFNALVTGRGAGELLAAEEPGPLFDVAVKGVTRVYRGRDLRVAAQLLKPADTGRFEGECVLPQTKAALKYKDAQGLGDAGSLRSILTMAKAARLRVVVENLSAVCFFRNMLEVACRLCAALDGGAVSPLERACFVAEGADLVLPVGPGQWVRECPSAFGLEGQGALGAVGFRVMQVKGAAQERSLSLVCPRSYGQVEAAAGFVSGFLGAVGGLVADDASALGWEAGRARICFSRAAALALALSHRERPAKVCGWCGRGHLDTGHGSVKWQTCGRYCTTALMRLEDAKHDYARRRQ